MIIELLIVWLLSTTKVKEEQIVESPIQPTEIITAVVTAYNSDPKQTDSTPDITADGTKVYDGVLACPRRYKFGTIVEIDGKFYECHDRMALRFDNRFDIWMENYDDAIKFGKQIKEVKIYDRKNNL